ncbi:unnamed protein product [Rotaria magnacalcarata]|uniref:PCI domain-containing protein n=1 Tax=Rotaria magnacalcarata TaxID=392030 RepID=A0A8S2KVZ4_9BILA|nr:unnamed protein product [Rotaria magnacalcarata]CAF3873378.1 unnamed protein product [Rotaria magnacalcarata]
MPELTTTDSVQPMADEKPKLPEQIELEEAEAALVEKNYKLAQEILEKLVKRQVIVDDEDSVRIKESTLLALGKLYKEIKDAKALASLIKTTRPFLGLVSRAKAAKLVRTLVDLFLDMEAGTGILHAAEDKDFKTAFSYFYEAFEGYDQINSNKGIVALKYMLLSKVMMNAPDDVNTLMSVKLALKYSGQDVEAMKAVAQASKKRSLADFQQALKDYKTELSGDPMVHSHLGTLYDNLLEQNLCRLLEPFSNVQIEHIAHLINLPQDVVEKKLSQMILDKKLTGILDQGSANIVIFDETASDTQYQDALVIIQNMSKVVDTLFSKTKKLS